MIINGPASSLPFPPFRQRFPWIGADLQTLRNTIRGTGVDLSGYTTERIRFPCMDGSRDVLLAALNRPTSPMEKPLVLLIHGLSGSEDSTHIIMAAHYFLSCGYAVLRLNQRGAGPSRETCKGYYHAGRSDDLGGVISQLSDGLTRHGVCLMGISLGGNVLLKCLAEHPRFAHVKAAVAVSPPIDLKAAQLRIMEPRNGKYQSYLLKRMKEGIQSSDLMDDICIESLAKIDTVYAFDDQIVAPANGFADAPDYYRSSSALELLDAIDTPTLIIHPADDPWVPVDPLLKRVVQPKATSKHMSVLCPEHGGHIGGHGRGSSVPWHNLCAEIFFQAS
ncbi:MAG: alpha/beta fold hydrolase [Alphaproteobacteria bacterium]|nr:alpha/beta fold hydrolase [Alphaproteobacteria bacterium]PHY00449.1 MAG: hypothetical protein CK529_05655 [Rhodospirillaceae bacterium]